MNNNKIILKLLIIYHLIHFYTLQIHIYAAMTLKTQKIQKGDLIQFLDKQTLSASET